MPVNASPEFYEAMKKFESARTPEEKLKALELLWKVAPKHKGAQKLLLWIKKEMKKYRNIIEKRLAKKSSQKNEYTISKEGDILVSIIGTENSGKSFFLNLLTGKGIKSTNIPFETTKPETGITEYEGVKIQFVEIPSNMKRSYCSIVHNSDLLLILISKDQDNEYQIKRIKEFLENCKIKVGERIIITKPHPKLEIVNAHYVEGYSTEDLKNILEGLGIKEKYIEIRKRLTLKDFINEVTENYVYKEHMIILNDKSRNIEKELILNKIISLAKIIRVYTKNRNKVSDKPVILKKNATIRDLVIKINKRWLKTFKYAMIIRGSRRIRAGLDYKLEDKDVVEIKY